MTTRQYDRIRVAPISQHVLGITLYNPNRRNAIGPNMVNELLWALEDAHADSAVRVIVLTGEGKAFCAGGDFSSMGASVAPPSVPPLPHKGDYADLLLAMLRTEKPIVARVNGPAMGGGLGLVAAATFAVAHEGAKLGTPEIDVGLFPMMIMALMARLIPRRRLLEMMMFGQRLTAAEAAEIGLINRVTPELELDEGVMAIVEELLEKSPKAIALGLKAFAKQDDMMLADALPYLRERFGEVLATDDAREGLQAFLEKREPRWTGK